MCLILGQDSATHKLGLKQRKSFKGFKEGVQDLKRNNNFRASLLGKAQETFYLVFQNELYMLKTMIGQSVMQIVQVHGFYQGLCETET